MKCWLAGSLSPVASALASCLRHDSTPGLGYPLRWLQAHLPSFLLRSSEPAAYGFTPISPVSTSSPFSCLPIAQGEPADSSSGAPCSTHCGSLKAPWERPLQSPPHPVSSSLPAGGGCAPLCRAAPWGFEEPMLPSPLPSLPSPMPAPACLSLGSRPCPPWGYSLVPCTPSQPWNAGCPTALPLHPISLHRHPPGDFTVLVAFNAICMPTTPSPP